MAEMPCANALFNELHAGDPWLPARMMKRSEDLPEWVRRMLVQFYKQGKPLRPFEEATITPEQQAYFEQAKDYCAEMWPNFTVEQCQQVFYLISGITPIHKDWAGTPGFQAIEERVLEAIAMWDAADAADAEAVAETGVAAEAEVGPGLPGHEVPRDGDEAVDGEIACDGEAPCEAVFDGDGELDGTSAIECEVVSGPPEVRTSGEAVEATPDTEHANDVVKPMHSHAWVFWPRLAALLALVVHAGMAVVAGGRAVMAWFRGRDKSRRFLLATALRPLCVWRGARCLATTARSTGRQAADGTHSCTSTGFGRGPPVW